MKLSDMRETTCSSYSETEESRRFPPSWLTVRAPYAFSISDLASHRTFSTVSLFSIITLNLLISYYSDLDS